VTFAFVRTFQGHLALAQLQLFEVLPASDFSDKLQVHPLPRLEVQLFGGGGCGGATSVFLFTGLPYPIKAARLVLAAISATVSVFSSLTTPLSRIAMLSDTSPRPGIAYDCLIS
jgi:hypothetical protein